MNGKVVHFEVPAKDLKRAKAFYSQVFGWKANDVDMQAGEYVLVSTTDVDAQGRPTAPGSINGGMMPMAEPFKGPVVTLQVDDITAALNDVEKHGGKTVTKRDSHGRVWLLRLLQRRRGESDGTLRESARRVKQNRYR